MVYYKKKNGYELIGDCSVPRISVSFLKTYETYVHDIQYFNRLSLRETLKNYML